MSETLYKIVPETAWKQAEQDGTFLGAGIDLADGFIHLSTAAQVRQTTALYFKSVSGLLLVSINGKMLGGSLVFEPSRSGELFPHFYGPLPLTAVLDVEPIPVGADGLHIMPGSI